MWAGKMLTHVERRRLGAETIFRSTRMMFKSTWQKLSWTQQTFWRLSSVSRLGSSSSRLMGITMAKLLMIRMTCNVWAWKKSLALALSRWRETFSRMIKIKCYPSRQLRVMSSCRPWTKWGRRKIRHQGLKGQASATTSSKKNSIGLQSMTSLAPQAGRPTGCTNCQATSNF